MLRTLQAITAAIAVTTVAPGAAADRQQDLLGILGAATPLAASAPSAMTIPVIESAPVKRAVTVDDIVSLRKIAALSVSPDGRRYAIYVRQADPTQNQYRSGWFVGEVTGGRLLYVGDGGVTRFLILPNGSTSGDLERPNVHWSPDSQWIAYALLREGEVQLWRSKADGSLQQRLTNNASDIVKFAWSDDGKRLMFNVGRTREEKREQAERRSRGGYRYDEDLESIYELLQPHLRAELDTDLTVWLVELDSGRERQATQSEQAEFERALERRAAGTAPILNAMADATVPPMVNANGHLLRLERVQPRSTSVRLAMSKSANGNNAVQCMGEQCTGMITKAWWSADGARAMFLRYEGGGRLPGTSLYSWSPKSGSVATVGSFPHDYLFEPHARGGRLLAIRQTPLAPSTLISIDERTGKAVVLADVNPEFKNIRISRVERIEWDAPTLPWNEPGGALQGTYDKRRGGYIIYPPDFEPSKKYPIFVDPYSVHGFSDSVGHEHPLQAYAAAGMIVLNSALPTALDFYAKHGADGQRKLYSAELDFPDMTMKMESTVRGIDAVASRGFIDTTRVGIGGVSNGTFIPLYMMQKYDRITAISIAAGSWGPEEYYWPTRRGRERMQGADWRPKPVGEGREYWRRIDIAEHIDEIEAPILMHHALAEAHISVRFMRHLADEGKPYDAYVYTDELHLKWQPAHLQSVMQRNYDWFRFWLQDYEDPAPEKQDQYRRWRVLREMQCKNRRSIRDFCLLPQ